MKSKHTLVKQAVKLKADILQIEADVAYYNRQVRGPEAKTLPWDPSGRLRECLTYLDRFLQWAQEE